MARSDDERRLLSWIAENGGPAATVNVVARSGEVGLGTDEIGEIIEVLADRELIDILEDGDVRLTAFGRALTDSSDE